MKRIPLYVFCLAVVLLNKIALSNPPEIVTLTNDIWRVEIATQSLEVLAQQKGRTAFRISQGQPGLGNVMALVQGDNLVNWKLPKSFFSVRAELIGDVLSVEFVSEASGNLTWPLIQGTSSLQGYIFPFFEGSYVPVDDKLWQDFLREQGAINTTSGLSMPFWGLDFGEWNLTYILTNPFNNRLTFDTVAEFGLGMRVSHAFTPNWVRKRYGVRISLGGGSPVTPAKTYRRWLKQNGEFVSFVEKVKMNLDKKSPTRLSQESQKSAEAERATHDEKTRLSHESQKSAEIERATHDKNKLHQKSPTRLSHESQNQQKLNALHTTKKRSTHDEKQVAEVEKLLGAAHIYLWGSNLLGRHDITDWKAFASKLSHVPDERIQETAETYIFSQLNAEAKETVQEIAQSSHVSKYNQRVVSRAISEQLEAPNFYNPPAWTGILLNPETERLLSRNQSTLSLSEIYRRNSLLFYAVFSDMLLHPDVWGDGLSVKLLERFAENGLDRLWLGVDSWQDGFRHPTAVAKAKALGYLIGPYDSYHSIHHPDEKDSWETAQFDHLLYEGGAIINADGTKNRGFKKKGYHLSPLAARPHVENRVNNIVAQMPVGFNSWFIDCDAYGELFDDYSPLHPATQLDDMKARLARIAWIRDRHHTVVGSEGGAAYAAATLHFAHGIMTPVIGWGDADMTTKTSPYYIGGYWPPEAPAIHIKQVPLKPRYLYLYFEPRFRLPLYQIVFHDSVVTTNHWHSGTLKFKNVTETLSLLELLYNVPPLYHLNMAEFSKHKAWIKRHYEFFSPLHRQIGGQAMTDFEWLTEDKQIQRTAFADTVEIFANFRRDLFNHEDVTIPARSIVVKWIETAQMQVFSWEK